MHIVRRRTLFLLLSASAFALGTQALAQAAAPEGGNTIEEIVVTAQRREQSIQDVPASITAYGQTAIKTFGISDVQDITRLTPGLSMTTSSGLSEAVNISIRGISSYVGTATTGVYIDDTPIQVRHLGAGEASTNAYPVVFDLDRIEVLRGPQGTLFGSSSEGGTVRFITREASLTSWSGQGRAEVSVNESHDNGYQVGIAGGGPIVADKLGFRASLYAQRTGGWVDIQPFPAGTLERNTNTSETKAAELSLRWAVNDHLTVTPSVFWQRRTVQNGSFYWRNLSNPDEGRFVSGQIAKAPLKQEFVLPSLKVSWDLGGATLISNTSYLDHKVEVVRDYTFGITETLTGDYTGPNTASPSYMSNPQTQFTQEIRLQSNGGGRLNWVVGAFYQKVDQRAEQTIVAPGLNTLILTLFGAPVPVVFGSDVLPGGVIYSGIDVSNDKQLAVFGQVDYKLTPKLTFTAGLRYSKSEFTFSNAQDGPFNGGPTTAGGGASQTDLLPKVGVNYKPTDDLMFYATAAKGFRPGGANVPVPSLCAGDLAALGLSAAPTTYSADHVWSYEVGSKGAALDRRLRWDASVYYIDWQNIQSSVYLPTCGFNFVGNLGAAVSKGFDVHAVVRPFENLTASASVGYTQGKYTQTVPGAAGPLVTAGDRLQSPPWHIVLAADYTAPLRGDLEGYLHVDYEHTAAYRTSNPGNALYDADNTAYSSVSVTSLRLGVRTGDWDAALFARNLFNDHPVAHTNHSVPSSSLYLDSTLEPRVVGVTVTKSF